MCGQGGDPHDHPPVVAAVARAARKAAIEAAVRQSGQTNVYLIHSSPGAERMAYYRGLGAEVVTIDPGRDVVRARCKGGQRPQRMYTVIDEWYREHGRAPTRATATERDASRPVFAFPSPSREW